MFEKRSFPLVVALGLLLAGSSACVRREPPASSAPPRRIIAMAPSLTETLVALGLEDRVVGITRYCPPVPGATVVGGFLDPNYEAILALDPDLVVTMQSHDELQRRLGDLGLDTLMVDQHDIAGVIASVATIAARCGEARRGSELSASLQAGLDAVAMRVAGRNRSRVLVVVGREPGGGRIGTLWAAAPDTFFHDVVRLAGGTNALEDSGIRYPEISREGLLAIDPDVIFDVIADGGARRVVANEAAADWSRLADLRAVAAGRVYVMVEDHVVIPGPRVVDTVEDFARRLHPEVAWN
ncbi:MAG: helical backbone metal receptor [Thermoanaerobaculales bacterium]|nr:helical backbone metal receptor [Thermoanaerobaculales bacterium]